VSRSIEPHQYSTLICCLLAVALAGCTSVGSGYAKPDLRAPETFSGRAPGFSMVPGNALANRDWWRNFESAPLNQLIESALAQNLDIQVAIARIDQAAARATIAEVALLPIGQANAHAASVRQSTAGTNAASARQAGYQRDVEIFGASFSASWELDFVGGVRRNIDAAQGDVAVAQANMDAIRLMIAAEVSDAYVFACGLQISIELAKRQINNQRQLVHLVQSRFAAGSAAERDIEIALGTLALIEAALPPLELELDVQRNRLAVLTGRYPGDDQIIVPVDAALPKLTASAFIDSPAAMIQRRPDLIAAERSLFSANARLGQSLSEYYPKISLATLIGAESTSKGNLFSGPASLGQGLLGLRWRIFDFARVDAEVAAAKGREAEAAAAYRHAVLRATEDVENGLSRSYTRRAQLGSLAASTASLRRVKEQTVSAYSVGKVSLQETIETDRLLMQAENQQLQAEIDSSRAAVAVFRALGG
jgi:NodT family efflux transporter outer membrane factor (OMF) lipoprotein